MIDRAIIEVMCLKRLHLVVGGQSVCGRVEADEVDIYSPAVGLLAWNERPSDRCGKCAEALVAKVGHARRASSASPRRDQPQPGRTSQHPAGPSTPNPSSPPSQAVGSRPTTDGGDR